AQSGRNYGESTERGFTAMDSSAFLVLGIGTNMPGIRVPSSGDAETSGLRNGWVQTSQLVDVGMMPDHWFGYNSVDLMVLGTGSDPSFWETLSQAQHDKRRRA